MTNLNEFESKEYFFGKIFEELQEYEEAEDKDKPKEYGDILLALFRYGQKMGYHADHHLEISWLKFNSRMRTVYDMIAINPNLSIKEAYKRAKEMEAK